MNSIQIGLLVVSAVVAALLALVQVRRPRERAAQFTVVFLFFFAVLAGLSHFFAYPPLNVWYQRRQIEPALAKMPLLETLKQYDAPTYAKLDGEIHQSFRQGEDQAQVLNQLRHRLDALVRTRLPRASDAAAIAYISARNAALMQLGKQAPALCLQLLVSPPGDALEARRHLSAAIRQANVSAGVEVIKSSARDPQSVPSESEVSSLLNAVYMGLAHRYGSDLSMLQHPNAPGVDPAKLCTMTGQLYANVLRLPSEHRGRILRFILAQDSKH